METKVKSRVLLVDRDPDIIASVSSLLAKEDYFVTSCSNAHEAAARISEESFDVVLADVQMPDISVMELLENIHKQSTQLPVILLTEVPDFNVALEAIRGRAFDLVVKPFNFEFLLQAVKRAVQHSTFIKLKDDYSHSLKNMVMEKTRELGNIRQQREDISKDLVGCLITVTEFQDNEAKIHGKRVGAFSELIALSMGMPMEFVRKLKISSQLHDIGKISIKDEILLKPGSLTSDEFEIVKTHTTEGKKLLTGSSHPVLMMAESIALSHHEKWNGTGYPEGLKSDDIPMEGRIVTIVDQYDVIRTQKTYKPALRHEEAVRIMTRGNERTSPEHFDPKILNAFIKISPKLDAIYNSFKGLS